MYVPPPLLAARLAAAPCAALLALAEFSLKQRLLTDYSTTTTQLRTLHAFLNSFNSGLSAQIFAMFDF